MPPSAPRDSQPSAANDLPPLGYNMPPFEPNADPRLKEMWTKIEERIATTNELKSRLKRVEEGLALLTAVVVSSNATLCQLQTLEAEAVGVDPVQIATMKEGVEQAGLVQKHLEDKAAEITVNVAILKSQIEAKDVELEEMKADFGRFREDVEAGVDGEAGEEPVPANAPAR